MQYQFKIIKEQQLVIETITGDVTVEGMIEKTAALFAQPDYEAGFCGVVDLRKAATKMSKVELYGFVQLIDESEQFNRSKWAILASSPMVVALSQIFQQRSKSSGIFGVFSTVAEAAKHLDRLVVLEHLKD